MIMRGCRPIGTFSTVGITAVLLYTSLVTAQVTFRSRVDAVRTDVSIVRDGRPVLGLSANDFDITDRGVPQRVAVTVGELVPLNIYLVLDNSRSVAGNTLDQLVEAARALVSVLQPTDRVALTTFSKETVVRVPLTADRAIVNSALSTLTVEANQTALRDALYETFQIAPNSESRQLVLVFTDGCDNASRISVADLLLAARRASLVVNAIQSGDCGITPRIPPAGMPNSSGRVELDRLAFLQQLAQTTGGTLWAFESTSSVRLRQLFVRGLDDMRARYVLLYYPQGVERSGWHDIRIRLKQSRADIKARPGYLVSE